MLQADLVYVVGLKVTQYLISLDVEITKTCRVELCRKHLKEVLLMSQYQCHGFRDQADERESRPDHGVTQKDCFCRSQISGTFTDLILSPGTRH